MKLVGSHNYFDALFIFVLLKNTVSLSPLFYNLRIFGTYSVRKLVCFPLLREFPQTFHKDYDRVTITVRKLVYYEKYAYRTVHSSRLSVTCLEL